MEQSQQPQQSKKSLDTGTKFITRDRVVLVEPFNADDNPNFKPKSPRQSRVVLFTRSFLSPKTPEDFARDHGFFFLEKDRVAINPDHFSTDPARMTFCTSAGLNRNRTDLPGKTLRPIFSGTAATPRW
jgi:hypothetical protein